MHSLRSALRRTPLLTLEPPDAPGGVTAARWSPARPALFAVSTSTGWLHFYDLVTDEQCRRPVHSVGPDPPQGSSGTSGNAAAAATTAPGGGGPDALHIFAFQPPESGVVTAAGGQPASHQERQVVAIARRSGTKVRWSWLEEGGGLGVCGVWARGRSCQPVHGVQARRLTEPSHAACPLQLWQLPEWLSRRRPGELELLQQLR